MKVYTTLDQLEPEFFEMFKKYLDDEFGPELNEGLTFKDLIGAIRECGDDKKTVDSNYIYHNYLLKINGYIFSCSGSEYLKDGGRCDLKMNNEISITKIENKNQIF